MRAGTAGMARPLVGRAQRVAPDLRVSKSCTIITLRADGATVSIGRAIAISQCITGE